MPARASQSVMKASEKGLYRNQSLGRRHVRNAAMGGYVAGFIGAIFGATPRWWIGGLFAWALGFGFYGQYDRIRSGFNSLQSLLILPETVPLWLVAGPFVLLVIGRLGHDEAMRYWRAARVVFGEPYRVDGPLFNTTRFPDGRVVKEQTHYFYMVKVDVRNEPYRLDDGRDVREAWSEIEVVDFTSYKPIASWREARWEDNKQPGYGDHPLDHYPDSERVRTLAANARPNILCVAIKPIEDEAAYPMRGADQLKPGWRSPDIRIPKGKYLLRVRIRGAGLHEKQAERTYTFTNHGSGGSIELEETNRKIGQYWP
jgi:hypothetical protein